MTAYQHDTVVPYSGSPQSKKEQVATMFDRIALKYDFLNRFLSAGIDRYWRKKAIQELEKSKPQKILDVATGTGDMAILTYRRCKPEQIIGIDISEGMLKIGQKKIAKLLLANSIRLEKGDSEAINYPDGTFDAVTVAFGVRNFEQLDKGLKEIYRVLKPGGKIVVLEFSKPQGILFKKIYGFYLQTIAPKAGGWISTHPDAYQYLHHSVNVFPEGQTFLHILAQTGFQETSLRPLSLGICTIYCGIKKEY